MREEMISLSITKPALALAPTTITSTRHRCYCYRNRCYYRYRYYDRSVLFVSLLLFCMFVAGNGNDYNDSTTTTDKSIIYSTTNNTTITNPTTNNVVDMKTRNNNNSNFIRSHGIMNNDYIFVYTNINNQRIPSRTMSNRRTTTEKEQQQQQHQHQHQRQNASTSSWEKGILLSILATIIGGVSKLAIRKSWIIENSINNNNSSTNSSTSCNNNSPIESQQQQQQQEEVLEDLMDDNGNDNERYIDLLLPSSQANDNGRNRGQEQRHKQQQYQLQFSHMVVVNKDNNLTNPHLNITRANVNIVVDYDLANDHYNNTNSEIATLSQQQQPCCENHSTKTPTVSTGDASCNSIVYAKLLRFCGMIGMTVLNPLCGLLAMNYLSPSICAPFSGLTMVWILLGSGPYMNEYPSSNQILACTFILLGELLITIFGDKTSGEQQQSNSNNSTSISTFDTVYNSYFEIPFLLYNCVLISWLCFLAYWINYCEKNHRHQHHQDLQYNQQQSIINNNVSDNNTEYTDNDLHSEDNVNNNNNNNSSNNTLDDNNCTITDAGINSNSDACIETAIRIDNDNNNNNIDKTYVCFGLIEYNTMKRTCWGLSGGSVNSWLNFLKDALTIIHSMNHNNNDDDTSTSTTRQYIFLTFLIIMAAIIPLTGLLLLSNCMKRYDATYSAAMFIGSYVLWASIMSSIHYNTFNNITNVIDQILYPIGLLILLYGIYLLIIESSTSSTTSVTYDDSNSNTTTALLPAVEPTLTTTTLTTEIQQQSHEVSTVAHLLSSLSPVSITSSTSSYYSTIGTSSLEEGEEEEQQYPSPNTSPTTSYEELPSPLPKRTTNCTHN